MWPDFVRFGVLDGEIHIEDVLREILLCIGNKATKN